MKNGLNLTVPGDNSCSTSFTMVNILQ